MRSPHRCRRSKETMPPKPRHLPLGHGVARVVGETRVQDRLDLGVSDEQVDDRRGVVAVAVHPDRQGLEAPQGQEGVPRAGHGADRVLDEARGARPELVVVGDRDRRPRRSARRGTWWWSAGRRRRPGRAGAAGTAWRRCCRPRNSASVGVGDRGDRRDVDDREQRVGRRLDPAPAGVDGPVAVEALGSVKSWDDRVIPAMGSRILAISR